MQVRGERLSCWRTIRKRRTGLLTIPPMNVGLCQTF